VVETRDSNLFYQTLINRPHNQFTTLDCHDGVPVKPDLDGIVDEDMAREVCDICEKRGARFTRVVSEAHKGKGGFDVHQICGAYYSLLGSDDAYIAARAIQFFVPGIPQLYYVGLLAGEHDEGRLKETGENRELNRHNYSIAEIDEACQKPVVQRLLRLIRFRNSHPAFNGQFWAMPENQGKVSLRWQTGDVCFCELSINLRTMKTLIRYICDTGKVEEFEA
jgi:sucrose phosphorylase